MNEKSYLSSPCEIAAGRVQYWFGKDKPHLLQWVTGEATLSKKRRCNPVKPPRIPSQVEHLPLQGYVLSRNKKQTKPRHVTKDNFSKPLKITIDASCCSVNQKNINHMTPAKALSPARVAYSRLKEHFLVSKRLKTMGKQRDNGPKRMQAVAIRSSTKEQPSFLPPTEYKEERHFQIGRVIKYLLD